MKINGKLEWKDYLQANYLNMRPTRSMQIALYILVLILLIGVGLNVYLSVKLGGDLTGLLPAAWTILGLLVAFTLYYLVFVPRRVRQIFGQHKEMPVPFEFEITPTGLIASNQYGSSNRPWENFHKWRENKSILMLYTSDIQFVLIPKRFCTDEQMEAIREHLREKNVRAVSTF